MTAAQRPNGATNTNVSAMRCDRENRQRRFLRRDNRCMKNSDRFQTIFDSTRSLGLIKTQNEFSRLCGRKDSWFSVSKAVERDLSIGVLITLATALERLPAEQIARSKRSKSKQLIRPLWLMIESKAITPIE